MLVTDTSAIEHIFQKIHMDIWILMSFILGIIVMTLFKRKK